MSDWAPCDCDLCKKEQEFAERGLCYRCMNGVPCITALERGSPCVTALDLIAGALEDV
jgi:hypothetical protein